LHKNICAHLGFGKFVYEHLKITYTLTSNENQKNQKIKKSKNQKIKIKNYRSIKNEITVDFNNELILIGPNNSGKTNFLKAIKLFFDGLKENQYSNASDLPFGVTGEQTSIVITFSLAPEKDHDFLVKFKEIVDLLEEGKEIDEKLINLYLSFSSTGRSNYRFFTNDKVQSDKRDEYRRLHEELVSYFLNRIVCNYIPSEKNSTFLFNELLLPHLKTNVGNILQEHQQSVDKALSIVSESISKNMREAGLPEMTCMFSLPGNLFASALTKEPLQNPVVRNFGLYKSKVYDRGKP